MRYIDDDDTSDCDSEEPSKNILSWRNDNTIMQTQRVAVKNYRDSNAHKSGLYNRRDGRRAASPASVLSFRSCQPSLRFPNSSNIHNRASVERTRDASPMSFRSVSNIGSVISTQEVKHVLENFLRNCKKEDIIDFMRIIKRRGCRRRPKKNKMRSLTKGAHSRYGGDSGDHCSDSSNSSKESKSSRSSRISYRSTNFSSQNRLNGFNGKNDESRLLRSTLTASSSMALKANHNIDNGVESFRTRDWDARSCINIDRQTPKMPIDEDTRSVRTLPSTFNTNNKFKNMFSLSSKIFDQNSTHTNCLSKPRKECTSRENVSILSLKSFGTSASMHPIEEKCKENEPIYEESARPNKSNCSIFYGKNRRPYVENDRKNKSDIDINHSVSKNPFRITNGHSDDNRSVRSVPAMFKCNKVSKAPLKYSFDLVPRSFMNATFRNKYSFTSTSQNQSLSKYNTSRLTKTFIREPTIDETDENDASPEHSLTSNGTGLIANPVDHRERRIMNVKDKLNVFGKCKEVRMKQNENSLKVSKKRCCDNVPVQSALLAENETTSSMPLREINNPISNPLVADEKTSHSHEEELLASSGTVARKNRNKPGSIDNDSDEDNNIIYKSKVNAMANNNVIKEPQRQNVQYSSTSRPQERPKPKTTNAFVFAKPKTPRPHIKYKSINSNGPVKEMSHEGFGKIAERNSQLSNNLSELMQQSDEEENIFYKLTDTVKEHSHISDDRTKSNLQHSVKSKLSEPSKLKESMDKFVFVKPDTPRLRSKANSKNATGSHKSQQLDKPKSSDLSGTASGSRQSISDMSLRPSFIRRKLFTQTLEITENSQNDSCESLPLSPVCNIYSMKPNDSKANRSILPKSLLQVDVDEHDLQKSQTDMSQLVQKIIPRNRITALRQNVQRSRKSQDDENSDDDQWDVVSIMSMYNKDDISDTYSDTGSDNVNITSKDLFNCIKGTEQYKNSETQLRARQFDYPKKTIDEPRIRAEKSDNLQVDSRCNLVDKRKAENLRNVMKTNANAQHLMSVKSRTNKVSKNSEKPKETGKTRRKRSLSEVNDSDVADSQSKRPRRSHNNAIDNKKTTSSEKTHTKNGKSGKKLIMEVPQQKTSKEVDARVSKNTTKSNAKFDDENNVNAMCQQGRVTRSSLTLISTESVPSRQTTDTCNEKTIVLSTNKQINKVNSTKKKTVVSETRTRKEAVPVEFKNLDSDKKSRKPTNLYKKHKKCPREVVITVTPLNRTLRNSLNVAESGREHRRTTPRKNVSEREPKTKTGSRAPQRGKSSEEVTTSRRTRRSLLHADEKSMKSKIVQNYNKKQSFDNNKHEAGKSKVENTTRENTHIGIQTRSDHGLGIVRSRLDIVPRHCERRCCMCKDDSKSIISSSTIMTRSRCKMFINAF